MGFGARVRRWLAGTPAAAGPTVVRFSNPTYPVDQLQFMKILRSRKLDRAGALSVPAVLRGRNMLCSIATLPLQVVDQDNRVQDHPLMRQIDPDVPNVVTLAATIEDLLFESIAWWKITGFTADGYPATAVRYAPSTVHLQPPDDYARDVLPSGSPTMGVIWMDGKEVPWDQVIRFDSPNPPLLQVGDRPIRRAIVLDAAADLYAGNSRMRGFFAPADDTVDPATDDEIDDMLQKFADSRSERLDGYVPAALKYTPIQDPTPAELQLIAQQDRADKAIANLMGIDPEDLGINTTSRVYQNDVDRRRDRVNTVLAPYMSAITDRLSMPDVTKRGYRARFWLDDYLKADPKTRAEVQSTYEQMGVTDPEEIRQAEGLPPRKIRPPAPAPAVPGRVPPTQISAIPGGARA